MKGYPIEKKSTVNQMVGFEVSGNVIPIEWFKHIKYENGKPHSLAILILADIVYWYRPIEERDEPTGSKVAYRKKFQADLLQRSYGAYADQYGYTKNQVKDAFDCLRTLGVIETEFRTVTYHGQAVNNVLFIGLKVDRLKEITYPLCDLNTIGGELKVDTPPQFKSGTNTEITDPEITPETNPENIGADAPPAAHENPDELSLTVTPGGRILHGLIEREFRAKKKRPPKNFPSLACKQKWLEQCEARLNGNLASAVNRALEKGIMSVTGIVDFVAKYDGAPKNPQQPAAPQSRQAVASAAFAAIRARKEQEANGKPS